MSQTMKDEFGVKLGDPEAVYELLEKLGQGSYGAVYKARDRKTNKMVALKKVPFDSDVDTIMNEITFMRECNSPFIIAYYDSYVKQKELWLAIEYCDVGSVSDVMKATGEPLNEQQICCIMYQALKGLEYLHSKHKIHRDIKAGNILVTYAGDCKLADFGVSKTLEEQNTKRQTVIGTPYWMAPEVIQEVGYDYKADIWSLGITAIELAEGQPPHADVHPMRAIFKIPTAPPPTLKSPEDWSDEFQDFLVQCLVKNPDDRPTATDLLKHAFIGKHKPKTVLSDLIDRVKSYYDDHGRADSDDDDDEQEQDATAVNDNNGSDGNNKDTLMAEIRGKTPAELRELINDLDKKMKEEIAELDVKFHKRRTPVLEAIKRKTEVIKS